jgi:hypothetical protein
MLVAVLALLVALGGSGLAASGLITGSQIKNGSITGADIKNRSLAAADLTRPLANNIAKAGSPGGAGKPGDRGPAGPPGPPAGQVLATAGGASSFVNLSACANTPLARATITLAAPSYVFVSFAGAYNYTSGAGGKIDASLTLTDANGQRVATGGPDVNFHAPASAFGQSDWSGFLTPVARGPALLVPAGTYTLVMTPVELLVTCGSSGQWSSIGLTAVGVRPAS